MPPSNKRRTCGAKNYISAAALIRVNTVSYCQGCVCSDLSSISSPQVVAFELYHPPSREWGSFYADPSAFELVRWGNPQLGFFAKRGSPIMALIWLPSLSTVVLCRFLQSVALFQSFIDILGLKFSDRGANWKKNSWSPDCQIQDC